MTPLEVNARKLVQVLLQCFPAGGTCEDLRRQFEKDTSLRRQSFYNALAHGKQRGWIVGGGSPHNQNQLYNLSPNGSWKEEPAASIGEGGIGGDLDKNRQIGELQGEVERLLNWSGGSDGNGKGVGLSSLVRIVGDSAASTRQRIKAAAAVLGYKAQADVSEFVRKYLRTVCESTDIATDYKIEAGELLRRHEAPRVTPDSVRPSYRDSDTVEPTEPPIPLLELVRQRRERSDRMQAEMIEKYGPPPQVSGGNRSDDTSGG
jgi:hypothetical protein